MKGDDLGYVVLHTLAMPNTYVVDSIFVHPKYNNDINEPKWDFALLRVSTAVPPNVSTPIALNVDPNYLTTSQESAMLTTMGYGATYEGSKEWSTTLQEVTTAYVPTFPNCQRAYENNLTEAEICAGNYYEGGQDACQGSGMLNVLRIALL